jgi:protein-S-isoprenylcysteine O-methyltransferase Ste14
MLNWSYLQEYLVKRRLNIAFLVVFLYIIHKIFDLHDKPFSFDNDMIGFGGFIIVLTGLFIRSWAAGIIAKNKKLTTVGPYSLWRHPLYLGSFLLAVGFCIILNDWFLWIIVCTLAFFLYHPKIKKEENKLSRLFPQEWKEYKKKTGFLIWQEFDLRKILYRWSLKQWLHHKEYNAWLAVTVVFVVIELWHFYL